MGRVVFGVSACEKTTKAMKVGKGYWRLTKNGREPLHDERIGCPGIRLTLCATDDMEIGIVALTWKRYSLDAKEVENVFVGIYHVANVLDALRGSSCMIGVVFSQCTIPVHLRWRVGEACLVSIFAPIEWWDGRGAQRTTKRVRRLFSDKEVLHLGCTSKCLVC